MSERTGSATDEERWAKWDDLRARQAAATTDEERAALAREEDALRDEGIGQMLGQELSAEKQWLWLSFADETGFLGASIVEGGGIMEATMRARLLGCNPGGEVLGEPLTNLPPEEYRERLLSREEIDEMRESGVEWTPIGS
jgi:hypothetical protein